VINKRLSRVAAATLMFMWPLAPLWAGDYLYLNPRYVQLTRQMLDQADPYARATFAEGTETRTTYLQATASLREQLDSISRARLFKKMKPSLVTEVKDKSFAENLNTFNFALQAIARKEGKKQAEIFPTYQEWVQTEAAVVQKGVDHRLKAFETRFGPESEQVNFIELFAGEALFRGDEAAPSPWEPIFRLSAVQLTTAGPGLVSSFQAGMNYYFVKSQPPTPLRWIGLSNHLGLAATLQYLNDPRLLRFEGRPAFGFAIHLDRKEIGMSWDPDEKTVRMSMGYAFQFIPFLM